MHVIGHHDVGVNLDPIFQCSFVKAMQVALIIGFREKTGFAIMTLLDDMLGYARQNQAGFA